MELLLNIGFSMGLTGALIALLGVMVPFALDKSQNKRYTKVSLVSTVIGIVVMLTGIGIMIYARLALH